MELVRREKKSEKRKQQKKLQKEKKAVNISNNVMSV